MGLSTHYKANLVALNKRLRVQYGSPKAKFVTASLGQTAQGAKDGGGLILDAMEHVADGTTYPEFKDNVASVYAPAGEHTRLLRLHNIPLRVNSSSNSCCSSLCNPYRRALRWRRDHVHEMNIGEAMGKAMTKMLAADKQ